MRQVGQLPRIIYVGCCPVVIMTMICKVDVGRKKRNEANFGESMQ